MKSSVKIIIILALSFIFVLFLAAKTTFALPPGGGDDPNDPCITNTCSPACGSDFDGDGTNDICDDDDDNDGDPDQNDCKPYDPDIFHGQTEICNDGIDNNCDGKTDADDSDCSTSNTKDTDNDGVKDIIDNCPSVANPEQKDFDHDGKGDACDSDDDDDDDFDLNDCEPFNPNIFHGQTEICGDNIDNNCDGITDPKEACETSENTANDRDGDGVSDDNDNCPDVYNPDQDEETCLQVNILPLPGIVGNVSSGGCGAVALKSKKENLPLLLLAMILLIAGAVIKRKKQ